MALIHRKAWHIYTIMELYYSERDLTTWQLTRNEESQVKSQTSESEPIF